MNAVHPNLTILGFYVERTSNNGNLLFVRIGPGGPPLTGMVTGVVSVESTTWSQVKGLYQD